MVILHHVSTAQSEDDIVLFGRDETGRSLAFFAPLRPVVYFRGDVDALRKVYSAFVASRCRGKNPNFLQPLEIDTVRGQSLSEWNYDGLYSVHRLRCEDVKQYWTIRRLFRSKSFRCTEYFHRSEERASCHDDGEFLRGGHWQLSTKEVNLFGLTIYNDQVSILVQWFVERGLRQNSVFAVEGTPCAGAPRTHCAAEFGLDSIAAAQDVTFDFGLIKIASYDIEVLPRKYPEFPSAEKGDPIINISVSVSDGSDVSFCVGSTAPGSGVRCYRDEKQMLVAFNQYLRRLDPDAIAGHNILKFDNIYFAKRCEELEVDNFNWSRFLGQKTKLRAFMNVEKMDIPGRFYVDTYPIFMQDHNLMSYKLDALAEHFLKSKKLDMPYSEINGAFATEEGRTKLCDYCQQDARLPLRLIEHGGKLAAAMALGKTAGCGADVILSRGQTIRILVLLHYYCREASPRIFIKSNSEVADDAETYEGAYVVDPKAGFYVAPIICVDFASLYPTIMMAYNISPDVKVSQRTIEIQDFKEGVDVDTMPDLVFEGDAMTRRINKKKPAFMSRDRRKGIFPQILEDLFKRRKELKKMMKAAAKAGDAVGKLNHNVAQLACKLLMNSFYGFLGFTSSPLYDRDLAAAVTGYGQQLTRSTVWFVEKKLRLQAIYGDTDSVFILADHMRGKTIEEIHAYGEEVAAQITTMFPSPVLMEYEKVYFGGVVDGVERGSYILVTKKRYAGRCVEEGSTKEKTDIKGLACKRRDRCKLVITAQKTLIEHFLNGRIDDGVAYARGILERLCRGDATVEELTITKALSKDPLKFAQNTMTHVFLAQRLARSTKHETPQKNDRISFLIRTGREKLYMRGVLPSEVDACVLDRGYYLNNQLRPAFMEILNLVVPDRAAAVFQGLPISTVGTGPINSFFKPVGSKRASKPPPRIIVAKKVKKLKKGDISQFFKKQ